jgi:hypothetical protein
VIYLRCSILVGFVYLRELSQRHTVIHQGNLRPPFALSYRHSFAIVRKMVLRHSLLKRSLAIILPMCSAWLFIACVSLCSTHRVETQTHCTPTLLNSVCFGQVPDCCPITTTFPSLLPERRVGTFLVNDHRAAVVPPLEPTRATLINNGCTSISVSGADPPFERLPSLRI